MASAISIVLAAQKNSAATEMDSAISAFLQSKRFYVKDTHWSPSHDQWHFKFTVEVDTLPTPQELAGLDSVFSFLSARSPYAYLCDRNNGPAKPWEIQFHRKDRFYHGIYGRYNISNDRNIRIVALNDSGHTVYYGLEWKVVPFSDRNGQPWRTVEGVLFAFKDGIWTLVASDPEQRKKMGVYRRPTETSDLLKYETLISQMNWLRKRTESESIPVSLRLYFINKIFSSFDGQLTQQEFLNVSQAMPPMPESEMTAMQKRILSEAIDILRQHTRTSPNGVLRRTSRTNTNVFANADNERMADMRYDWSAADSTQVQVIINGQAANNVTVTPRFPDLQPYEATGYKGKFFMMDSITRNQLLSCFDHEGNNLVLFADGTPATVDLRDISITEGSELNKRFVEVQRQLKAMQRELHKYSIQDTDGDFIVVDSEGYKQLLEEAHKFQLQLMDENLSNMIPAWLLADNFASMSYEELSRYLKRDRPYANHIALQPVWNYFEGLGKRQPGKMFTDAECVDTTGVTHHLSEYIGQGDYVVLQFWEENNWAGHKGCNSMKKMKRHHRDQNIRFIGLSLDANKKTWKGYVKSRLKSYEHLAAIGSGESTLWDSEAARAYGIMTMPETIVFDPEGRIISSGLAADDLVNFVDSLPLKKK